MRINMSNVRPAGIAYPPRLLAEPRSGRYAGCESAASEVFGCIPNGARAPQASGCLSEANPKGRKGPRESVFSR